MRVEKKICARCGKRLPLGNFMLAANVPLLPPVNFSKMNTYAVTGTFHGSIIYADSEGDARRLFHKYYNGESILTVKLKPKGWFPL